MARYHLNKKGEPGTCKAMVQCPFGDLDSEHYASADEARKAYEDKQAAFMPTRTMPRLNRNGKVIKPLKPHQLAEVEVMNNEEFMRYESLRVHGEPHTGAMTSIEILRKSGAPEFQDLAEARAKAREVLGHIPPVSLLTHPHDEKIKGTTANGNTFSKTSQQADGSQAQTINGVTIIIHAKNRDNEYKISTTDGTPIGSLKQNHTSRKWEVTYDDGSKGRDQKFPVDANTALMKKAGLLKPPVKPKAPSSEVGYEPVMSELDLYEDFPDNKSRTITRLRQLDSEDLVRMFNRLAISAHNGHYGNEIASDESAMRRVEKVLAERKQGVEISTYGGLRPGEDHASVNSYKLREK